LSLLLGRATFAATDKRSKRQLNGNTVALMLTEILIGLIWNQIGAGFLHLAVLLVIQHGLDRLAKKLHVDHLSLVNDQSTKTAVVRALLTRFDLWIWGCGLYTLLAWHFNGLIHFPLEPGWATPARQADILQAITVLALSSLGGRLIYVTNQRLRALAAGDSSHWESVVAVLCADLLQVGIPLVATMFALGQIGLPSSVMSHSRDFINALVILATGYIACRQVSLAADKVIQSHRSRGGVDMRSRALYTEVSALRKAILLVLAFLTVATTMIFCAPLRHLGTSLLASAGLITVLAGVVVQRSLGHLFTGFQLALTQPILLDDLIVVEGQLGKVEEITLAYVVLHLWDQRRLVVPISYFLEKPFENWTRRSSELLGTVFLYFDYHLPVDELREEFLRYVDAHPAWDRRTKSLVISEAKETSIQVRALVSAADPDKLWALRCDVREALISYVKRTHPSHLVQTRVSVQSLPPQSTPLTQPGFQVGQGSTPLRAPLEPAPFSNP
jgi:small-conductance mechanosensitive channel